MILSDRTIKEYVASGKLGVTPFDEKNVQGASLDITLSNSFAKIIKDIPENKKTAITTLEEGVDYNVITNDSYILYPKKFILASTAEHITLPADITAEVMGRSSIGRLGIFVQNAGWIDPGWDGQITLELYNAGNVAVELKAGVRIGQLVFSNMTTPADNPYKGKYTGQRGATGSRIQEDFT